MRKDPLTLVPALLRKSPGKYYCISTKSPTGKWTDHFFARNELGKIPNFIKKHAKSDVYMCAQGFSQKRRHKDYAGGPCVLWADLDECDPRKIDIRPTIALQSSPDRYVGFWICDEPVSENLNQRLSYHIGADNSGWDWTQVLRVPGTLNHKYEAKPEVKVLWDDGPRYETHRLEKIIPQLTTEEGQVEGGDAAEVYSDYEKHMPRWLRKEFTQPKVQQGKRSEVLWKMINQCLEIGMSKEETFTICWHSNWNKQADRS